ncbi:ThuA domain-containing protein [Pedobacter frigiditerrae]|uniref:ThuA domain-containing protein n=1 Tax=Pedobacter frigiditerrae TaxID=2530452 RepID=A0A4R0MWN2_9SPHI|nr:ThuA domain-containing protein [Pedobacter frigiditerrae]TCC91669.1 ThuA domain-containing protein [Pedobacter frigiditerrae]
MKLFYRILIFILCITPMLSHAQKKSRFKVVALYENGGNHTKYSAKAVEWLNQLAMDSNFTVDYIKNTERINDEFLKQYQLFIQLDYPPYAWTDIAKAAFEKYMVQKKGASWIGFHHATLLGDFDGYKLWNWFSDFMGGITFKSYIPGFASGKVNVELPKHPIMKGVTHPFIIKKEEWYTYDKNPRPNVEVIASVDESSYEPDTKVKMGDHPVIWSNPKMKAKNVYIFMGHGADLFENEAYKLIFKNAIFWATKK